MGWEDLLNDSPEKVLPWFGSDKIHDAERSWVLKGRRPPEHGWYRFSTPGGRNATLVDRELQPTNMDWGDGQPVLRGYLVGDRFIPDDARVDPDPDKLIEQTIPVYCVELGLQRFARAAVIQDREGSLVYLSQEFPAGPEEAVILAYQDRKENVNNIVGVTPPLDLAFRWVSLQRLRHEEHLRELERIRAEEEAKRAEEERMQQLMKQVGTPEGRRALAVKDFDTAAREALRVGGAELLDTRQAPRRREMVVQYRFQQRRLECVVEKDTLRIVDAGVCLNDHRGTKGDTFFTLESLPGVIGEAIRKRKLVVWRHVPGDNARNWDDDDDDYDEDDDW